MLTTACLQHSVLSLSVLSVAFCFVFQVIFSLLHSPTNYLPVFTLLLWGVGASVVAQEPFDLPRRRILGRLYETPPFKVCVGCENFENHTCSGILADFHSEKEKKGLFVFVCRKPDSVYR